MELQGWMLPLNSLWETSLLTLLPQLPPFLPLPSSSGWKLLLQSFSFSLAVPTSLSFSPPQSPISLSSGVSLQSLSNFFLHGFSSLSTQHLFDEWALCFPGQGTSALSQVHSFLRGLNKEGKSVLFTSSLISSFFFSFSFFFFFGLLHLLLPLFFFLSSSSLPFFLSFSLLPFFFYFFFFFFLLFSLFLSFLFLLSLSFYFFIFPFSFSLCFFSFSIFSNFPFSLLFLWCFLYSSKESFSFTLLSIAAVIILHLLLVKGTFLTVYLTIFE